MKRLASVLLVMLIVIWCVGCGDSKNNINNTHDENVEDTPVSYRDTLEKIFIKETGNELEYYSNNKDYGHVVRIIDVEEKPELTIIKMEGTVLNLADDLPVQRNFEVQYVINDNSIREIIHNYDMYKSDGNIETLNSIIPNQIILQTPLEAGNLWFQKFNYLGKEYTAQTKIVDVSENEEGKKIYETETVVENIEGFPNNTYTETRIYEEGKGLVFFKNTKPSSSIEGEDADFKYSLNRIRKIEKDKDNAEVENN